MSSTKKRITKAAIEGMSPGEVIWDTKLTGFGVRYQRRDRVFLYKCRIGSRQRWFSIGKFGQPWTVDMAENRVKILQGEIAKDADPASLRDEKIRNPTLKEAGDVYLQTEIAKKSGATQVLYRDFLERLIYPKYGRTKVADFKFSDVSALHHGLRETPITANRVIATLSTFFNWCELHGHRPKYSNPTQGIKKFKETSKERFLSPRELTRLGVALNRAERNKTETVYAIAAIRLLIFTGCRRNEILTLRWGDVNLERAILSLRETKTGSRVIYLSAPAISVIKSIPRVSKNPYVIAGEREARHLVNLRKCWLRICKVARLKQVRLHDLRHSFASIGVSGGASLPIIGKLLGHSKSSTTEKYSHLSADPVRAVNEAMGRQISDLLHGAKKEAKA
ncbi:MAG: site-specific integrase [Aestuariivirga sp.]